jgi:urease accessory protein
MTVRLDTEALARLLQLSSPTLPTGGYSYSQGMEAAVELKLVHDEQSAANWIKDQLMIVMVQAEAPLWCLLFEAWRSGNQEAVYEWNQWFYATRETAELRHETKELGRSLLKLCQALNWGDADSREVLTAMSPVTHLSVHAYLCSEWKLSCEIGVVAYLFTWAENQVAAAIKSVPIGQLAGQRILAHIRQRFPEALAAIMERSQATPPSLNTFTPQFAIISSRHESQFSRLFRS